jgi:hypothetical protein
MSLDSQPKSGIGLWREKRERLLDRIRNNDPDLKELTIVAPIGWRGLLPDSFKKRQSDRSAVVCHEFARQAMRDGDVAGALKLLDVVGTSPSDSALLYSISLYHCNLTCLRT